MNLQGQVALITGAGKGIGKAVAKRLAAEGVNLALVARTESDLQRVADEIHKEQDVQVGYAVADVSNRSEVEAAIAKLRTEVGAIDILLNNAGIAAFGSVMEMEPDEWERIVRVNLFGTYYVTRAVLSDMMDRKSGAILNVSSTSGLRGAATTSAYSASKFGVQGFTESLMQEARKYNIRVTSLTPSTVNTELASSIGLKIGEEERMLQPEDVAELVYGILSLHPRAFINTAGIWTTNPQ